MSYEIVVHNAEWMIAATDERGELIERIGPFMRYREAKQKMDALTGR